MAKERTLKEGLEFFPLDVDYFEDSKILKIEATFGITGSLVATRLLCAIYRNGYYLAWDDDEALVIARKVGNNISWETVNQIVSGLIKCDFFSEAMFTKFGILTSHGIQERWNKIIIDCNRKARIKSDFNLLMHAQKSDFKIEKSDLSHQKSDDLQQSKVKESKVEESKENELALIENSDFKYEEPVPREATDLVEDICDYFEVKKILTSKLYNSIDDFVRTAMHRNELTIVSLALQKYMAYKARSQEAKHNVLNWIGTKDSHYTDGHWYTTDWDLKLKNSNTHAPIERETTAASAVITGGKAFGDIRKRRAN